MGDRQPERPRKSPVALESSWPRDLLIDVLGQAFGLGAVPGSGYRRVCIDAFPPFHRFDQHTGMTENLPYRTRMRVVECSGTITITGAILAAAAFHHHRGSIPNRSQGAIPIHHQAAAVCLQTDWMAVRSAVVGSRWVVSATVLVPRLPAESTVHPKSQAAVAALCRVVLDR